MTNLDLSVILPVRDGLPFLGEALDSVLAQEGVTFEVIALDDGSSDGSGSFLDERGAGDQRLRVLHGPGLGLVEVLNCGLRLARAPYIARMDADDIAMPGRFSRQLARLRQCPNVAVLGGTVDLIDAGGASLGCLRYPIGKDEVAHALLRGSPVAHPAVMMQRDTVLALGGYRSAFEHAEDYDMWLRIAEHHSIDNLSDVVLRYRRHAESISIRSVRQQALSALAARVCADLRRTTNFDPAALRKTVVDEGFLREANQAAVALLPLWSLRAAIASGGDVANKALDLEDAVSTIVGCSNMRQEDRIDAAILIMRAVRHHVRADTMTRAAILATRLARHPVSLLIALRRMFGERRAAA